MLSNDRVRIVGECEDEKWEKWESGEWENGRMGEWGNERIGRNLRFSVGSESREPGTFRSSERLSVLV